MERMADRTACSARLFVRDSGGPRKRVAISGANGFRQDHPAPL